jgi:hypothetical protein
VGWGSDPYCRARPNAFFSLRSAYQLQHDAKEVAADAEALLHAGDR